MLIVAPLPRVMVVAVPWAAAARVQVALLPTVMAVALTVAALTTVAPLEMVKVPIRVA